MTEVNRGESESVMAETWAPGETIVGQSVWGGKVRVACPMFVIHDRPDVLATYIPRGTIKFRYREGYETRRVGLEAMLLDEHIAGGHGERGPRLRIGSAPMHHFFKMADQRQPRVRGGLARCRE